MLVLALQLLSQAPSGQQRPRPRASAPGLEFPVVPHTLTAAPSRRLLGVGPPPDRGRPQIGTRCRPLHPAPSRCKLPVSPTRGRDTRRVLGGRGSGPRLPSGGAVVPRSPSSSHSSHSSHSGGGRMARAARDRGVDAAQTGIAAAMASRAPPLPSRAASRPAPPAPRLRPARGTFPGVPGNHGPRLQPSTPPFQPSTLQRGPRPHPTEPTSRNLRDHPSGDLGTPKPHLPRFLTPATQNWRICPFILNSVLFNGPKVHAKL